MGNPKARSYEREKPLNVDVTIVADILNECGALDYHHKYYEQAHRQLNRLSENEGRLILQDILEKVGE